MKIRIVVTLILLLLFAVFVAVNWSAFLTPASLSLLFTTVQAPLGIVLLCVLGGMAALFAAYMAYWQGTVLLETRRHTKELQTQRELADRAEASRFTELQTRLERDFAAVTSTLTQRIDAHAASLKTEVEQSGNSLAAHIGELEDRIERQSAAPGALRSL